jgi:1-acyl-sn-glycerol-3-phosphate acyltransferase
MEESSDRRFAARLAPLVPGKETPHASASVAAKLARVFLTRLGIPKLWREDPEVLWPYARLLVSPTTLWLAPSYGYGLERVPPTGGGVVAVNHLSAIDPPLVGSLSPRTIYYMAKVELLSMPIVGDILMWTGAFPVRRGEGDRESLRQAREIARAGHMVGVFVEGTRQRFVYSFGWSPKKRMPCAVVWGDPIDVTGLPRSGRGYKSAAGIVGAEILRLWRLAGAAIAAGFPSELPDGSRRTEARYLPVREGSTPSPSTSVKKAAA